MKKEDMEQLLKVAAKKYVAGAKVNKPAAVFVAGAQWLWELLYGRKEAVYYEERLRSMVADRCGRCEPWQEDLIATAADTLVDRDETSAEIRQSGRTWVEFDKNMNQKKVSCPHVAHKKDIVRSLILLYESLGLSYKATPSKMVESVRRGVEEDDPMKRFYESAIGKDL